MLTSLVKIYSNNLFWGSGKGAVEVRGRTQSVDHLVLLQHDVPRVAPAAGVGGDLALQVPPGSHLHAAVLSGGVQKGDPRRQLHHLVRPVVQVCTV